MAQQKRGKQADTETKIVTDPYMVAMIRTLLANMIGDHDRYYEMDEAVTHDDLPPDMPFERDVLRVLEHLSVKDKEPTREAVMMGLHVLCNRPENTLAPDVDALLEMQTDGLRPIRTMAHFVWQAARTRQIHSVITEAQKKVVSPVGDVEENLDAAIQMLSEIAQEEDASEQRTANELVERWIEFAKERKEARKGGMSFPSFKYKGLTGEYDPDGRVLKEGKIPAPKWGESALISAQRGFGKTTVGGDLAEYNAWVMGHDVLYIHLETGQETMMDRSIARNVAIPTDYLAMAFDHELMGKPLNPNNIHSVAAHKVREYFEKIEGTRKDAKWHRNPGELIYKYCPGYNVFQIINVIKTVRRRSQARGRALVVFVDYYNIIDYSQFGNNRAEALGRVALELRNCVKRENIKSHIYMVLLAQENTDDSGNAYTYGSREIEQYVQVYISLKREVAKLDKLLEAKGGGQAVDVLGYPRWWHRAGELDSQVALNIIKANDAKTGSVIVNIENQFFRIQG